MDEKVKRMPKLITVSERNLQNAAVRLLPKHNKLVSTEVEYLRRVLGDKATQVEIESQIRLVRETLAPFAAKDPTRISSTPASVGLESPDKAQIALDKLLGVTHDWRMVEEGQMVR